MRKLIILSSILICASSVFGQVAGVSGACSAQSVTVSGALTTKSLTCTPNATNHAIIIADVCAGATESGPTIAATGWTFTALGTLSGTGATTGWLMEWGALAPNTSSATITVTWPSDCGYNAIFGGEFSGNDTTGGTTTFYATNKNSGASGGCSGAAVTSTSASDGAWAVCTDSLPTTNWQGAGWTAGVQDSQGDGTEFKIATGAQTPTWTSTSGAFNVVSATIKASGGGGGVARHRAWVISQ